MYLCMRQGELLRTSIQYSINHKFVQLKNRKSLKWNKTFILTLWFCGCCLVNSNWLTAVGWLVRFDIHMKRLNFALFSAFFMWIEQMWRQTSDTWCVSLYIFFYFCNFCNLLVLCERMFLYHSLNYLFIWNAISFNLPINIYKMFWVLVNLTWWMFRLLLVKNRFKTFHKQHISLCHLMRIAYFKMTQ